MGIFDFLFPPPNRDKFVGMVIAALQKAGDRREAVYDKSEFRITFSEDGKDAGVVNLQNIYAEFRLVPRSHRKNQIQHIARSLLSYLKETPADYDEAKHDLLPVVRTACYLDFISLRSEIEGKEWPESPCMPSTTPAAGRSGS